MRGDDLMRPLLEILEDERMLMLKLDTIYQNMLRFPDEEIHEVLRAKRSVVVDNLESVRVEIREYFENMGIFLV